MPVVQKILDDFSGVSFTSFVESKKCSNQGRQAAVNVSLMASSRQWLVAAVRNPDFFSSWNTCNTKRFCEFTILWMVVISCEEVYVCNLECKDVTWYSNLQTNI